MSNTVHIHIVSAENSVFEGDAEMVYAPGSQGELGIAPMHTPLLTALRSGEVRVVNGKDEQSFFISGGMLEVQPKLITVLSDTAVRATDLDEARAIEAKERAEKMIAEREEGVSYADAVGELQQAMAQIETIARLKKKASSRH